MKTKGTLCFYKLHSKHGILDALSKYFHIAHVDKPSFYKLMALEYEKILKVKYLCPYIPTSIRMFISRIYCELDFNNLRLEKYLSSFTELSTKQVLVSISFRCFQMRFFGEFV